MPKQKTQNPADENITIEVELPVPLGELAMYVFPKKEDENKVFDLLNSKPYEVNYIVDKIARKILKKKSVEVKLSHLQHDYNDSENISHGVAYFTAILQGTENELKKVAGEDKLFSFDWTQQHVN